MSTQSRRFAAIIASLVVGVTLWPIDSRAQRSSEQLAACAPIDLAESMRCLDAHLPDEARTQFADGADVPLRHLGIGLWLRNNWGLWRGGPLVQFFNSNGVRHPDSMSGIILRAYDLHLTGCQLEWNDVPSVQAATTETCASPVSTPN